MTEPFLVNAIPKPAERNATKPLYIVKVDNSEGKKQEFLYFLTRDVVNTGNVFELKGYQLTPKEAEDLRQNPIESAYSVKVNWLIPWHRIIRIENISYKGKEVKNEQK